MTRFDLRQFRNDKDYAISCEGVRVVVAGAENRTAGYGIGFTPTGREARQVFGGPLVPGPWGYAYGLATVIDNYGGTGADRERERREGRLIEANVGDELVLDDDLIVRIELCRRGYPKLVNVEIL
jgi:hypothetical protein